LARLALLRLTEVEVHGSDLTLGLDDWSETFVDAALPFRVQWLNTRRANHRAYDGDARGSWLLRSTDGPDYVVAVDGLQVEARVTETPIDARATVVASSRDLLALLLGRPTRRPLRWTGDVEFGNRFSSAFPGP
jgi:hypothetical protein